MSLNIDAELLAACRQQTVQKPETLSLAVIGGSGLDNYPGAETVAEISVQTPYAEAPLKVKQIRLAKAGGAIIYFLPRHGVSHTVAPHLINYRANIWALKALQVEEIIAVNAVGGISDALPPGRLALLNDVIDYSHGREGTFFDGVHYPLDHIDCSQLFHRGLNQSLAEISGLSTDNCYACTQGPRIETPAEIQRLKRDGCDVVGMTTMPEAALAAEAEIPYAAIAMIVNWASGLSDEMITMEDIYSQLISCTEEARDIIQSHCVKSLSYRAKHQ
ncbi:S-methyl-5'-thioinosine phosphorylase [Pseudoteredinibacter isoporae]|uniref:S-methyl-5'-thioinosine phosphorylase n=1 Tax=Pseudoteredinibacter isoporae TaxID=570281 RepID=UPI00310A2267